VLSNPTLFARDEDLFDGPEGSALNKLRHALVVMNGQPHRRLRSLVQPAFAKPAVDGYCADIVSIAARALAGWPRSALVDASALCHELMLAGRTSASTASTRQLRAAVWAGSWTSL
jgi:cytochrome P450